MNFQNLIPRYLEISRLSYLEKTGKVFKMINLMVSTRDFSNLQNKIDGVLLAVEEAMQQVVFIQF